jgi:hypothetical protein
MTLRNNHPFHYETVFIKIGVPVRRGMLRTLTFYTEYALLITNRKLQLTVNLIAKKTKVFHISEEPYPQKRMRP